MGNYERMSPFCDVVEREILSYHIGHHNLREKPIKITPLEYQQLYQKCWDHDPEKRPDINQVYEMLSQFNINDTNDTNKQQYSLVTAFNSNNNNFNTDLCIESRSVDCT